MLQQLMKRVLALAPVALCASPASAHITLEVKQAEIGASYKAVFRVPHGCAGSATTAISIEIPEGLIGVKPMPEPGWTIALERGSYARSYQHYHGAVSEGVRRVTWSGGKLPDEHFGEFVLNGFIARELDRASALYFPVRQTCQTGEIHWTELPQSGENVRTLEYPAATLTLVAAQGGDGRQGQPGEAASAGIAIEGAWVRATPPGADAAAAYMRITNEGKEADRLVSASFDGAGRVEIHETIQEEGVVRMREREEGIELAPGETVSFAPRGLHFMLLELEGALSEGEETHGVLRFEKTGDVKVTLPVRRGGPASSQEHQHQH